MLETQQDTAGSLQVLQRGNKENKMEQITIVEFRKLKVPEVKALLPIEITADGEVIAEVSVRGKLSTKCPNCGLVYETQKPTDAPYFFSIKH